MKRKKDKNIDNEALIRAKKERETVDRLVEEEKAAKKANKVKYGPGARSTAIIITSVSCFLLVLGGIFMINEMKKSDKYNSGNEVYTPAASSASTPSTTAASIESSQSNSPEPVESETTEEEDSGYHPIQLPETSSTTKATGHNITIVEPYETENSDDELPIVDPNDDPVVPEKTTAATHAVTTTAKTTERTYTMNAPDDTVSPPKTTFSPDDERYRDFESGHVIIETTTGTYDIFGWDIFE